MIRSLLIALAWVWVVYAQITFYPVPEDTVIVSFDTLHLSTKGGSSASFYCSWPAPELHKDSISWLIDSVAPSAAVALVTISPNPRDLPVGYCLGSTLGILPQARRGDMQGVHKIDLTIKFPDSTITVSWYYKYGVTKYKAIHARVIIDSFWTAGSSRDGYRNYTRYKILDAEKIDTSLFGNAFYGGDFSCIENDTIGIMREYIAQKSGMGTEVSNYSIDCIVIQILYGDPARSEWILSDSLGSFLRISHEPFPLVDALRGFNEFIRSHGLYRGYAPPAGDLKIGPIFRFTPGDPGWKVYAFHDDAFWYVDFWTGYGDCPCGCTEWRCNRYKIGASGEVESISLPALKRVVRASTTIQRQSGSQSVYSLQGRRVWSRKWLPSLGTGAYIARYPGNKRLMRIKMMGK